MGARLVILSRSEESLSLGDDGFSMGNPRGVQRWEMLRLRPQHDRPTRPLYDTITVVDY